MDNNEELDVLTIDLDANTVDMPLFPLYKFEEVEPDMCCISLKLKDGKYYSVYEDGEEYEMYYVTFDRVDLLKAKKLTIDEMMIVINFVNELVDKYNDTDFILNNELVIRFNFA